MELAINNHPSVCEIFSYGSFHCNFFSGVENRKDSEKNRRCYNLSALSGHTFLLFIISQGDFPRAEMSQAFSL